MNNGAFGENFPYSNFHDLNMDWIIKIAKDFLDQYTTIQETIDTGLEDLTEKADTLEGLLQAWYDEHSEDIANQLASATQALGTALTSAISSFNSSAEQKARETIATIPDNYTELSNKVLTLQEAVIYIAEHFDEYVAPQYTKNAGIINIYGDIQQTSNTRFSHIKVPVTGGETIYWSTMKMAVGYPAYGFYDSSNNFFGYYDSGASSGQETGIVIVPFNATYMLLNIDNRNNYNILLHDYSHSEYAKKPVIWYEHIGEVQNGLVGTIQRGDTYTVQYSDVANFKHMKLPVTYADNGKIKVQHSFFQAVNFGKVFFIDSNNKVLDYIDTSRTSGNEIIEVNTMPFNVAYIICNLDNIPKPKYFTATEYTVENYHEKANQWTGKKIVWYGTSISAGGYIGKNNNNAIPQKVAQLLGAEVVNEAIGSSCVHCKLPSRVSASNPYGFYQNFEKVSRCLTNSTEELEWIVDHWNTEGLWNVGTVSEMTPELSQQILSNGYETKIDNYLNVNNFPDLFIIEHGYNDVWNSMEQQDQFYQTYGNSYLYSYRAGMNFIIERILSYNPRAKIILLSHYTAGGNTATDRDVAIMQEVVADSWDMPMLKQWEKLGWTTTNNVNRKGHWLQNGGSYEWVATEKLVLEIVNYLKYETSVK